MSYHKLCKNMICMPSLKKIKSHNMNLLMSSWVLLVWVSTGVVWGLAAHVLTGHLHSEERSVGTHTEFVTHPVITTQPVSAGGTWEASRVDHHSSIQDDAVFLSGGKSYSLFIHTRRDRTKIINKTHWNMSKNRRREDRVKSWPK